MSDSPDRSFENDTISFLGMLVCCALVVPFLALLLVYAYSHFSGAEFTKKEWKNIIAIVYVATLFLLTVFALRNRRGTSRRKDEPEAVMGYDESGARSPADKWEYRNSRFIMRKLYLASLLVPLAGMGFGIGILKSMGTLELRNEWKLFVVIYWIASSLTAAWFAIKSRKQRTG